MRDHLIGEDDCDRDRDQRLPELLTLVPAKEQLLHSKADEAYRQRCEHRRNQPLPEAHLRAQETEGGVLADELALELQGHIATEQEEGPVRHVHDSHQSEDERETAGDDEVHACGGEAVQQSDDEVVPVVDRRPERRLDSRTPRLRAGPGGEQDPHERESDEPERHHSRRKPSGIPVSQPIPHRQGERTNVARSFQRGTNALARYRRSQASPAASTTSSRGATSCMFPIGETRPGTR